MTLTAIRGGTILDQNGRRQADLVVDDDRGLVVDRPVAEADRTLDAEGCDELCAVDERQALQTHLTVGTHDRRWYLSGSISV